MEPYWDGTFYRNIGTVSYNFIQTRPNHPSYLKTQPVKNEDACNLIVVSNLSIHTQARLKINHCSSLETPNSPRWFDVTSLTSMKIVGSVLTDKVCQSTLRRVNFKFNFARIILNFSILTSLLNFGLVLFVSVSCQLFHEMDSQFSASIRTIIYKIWRKLPKYVWKRQSWYRKVSFRILYVACWLCTNWEP